MVSGNLFQNGLLGGNICLVIRFILNKIRCSLPYRRTRPLEPAWLSHFYFPRRPYFLKLKLTRKELFLIRLSNHQANRWVITH